MNGSWVLYPKTANELCKEFGVNSVKPTGKKVWDMYEEKDFVGIQKRTEGEVRDAVALYKNMRKRIFRKRNQRVLKNTMGLNWTAMRLTGVARVARKPTH